MPTATQGAIGLTPSTPPPGALGSPAASSLTPITQSMHVATSRGPILASAGDTPLGGSRGAGGTRPSPEGASSTHPGCWRITLPRCYARLGPRRLCRAGSLPEGRGGYVAAPRGCHVLLCCRGSLAGGSVGPAPLPLLTRGWVGGVTPAAIHAFSCCGCVGGCTGTPLAG